MTDRLYEKYLCYLRDLVSLPTVFTDPANIQKAMDYCKDVFEENLNGYEIYFDGNRNLIAQPEYVDSGRPVVYLNAHIDTVGADPSEWDPPFHPWNIFEDEKEMAGRGVNDCKAGAAYQLFLSGRARDFNFRNLVFSLTFKEEGAGEKTSVSLGREIGGRIPANRKENYLIVLENTVKIESLPVFSIFTKERGNFVIGITGTISFLKHTLSVLDRWNPAAIVPLEEFPETAADVYEQPGGHLCGLPREDNKLTEVILNAGPLTVIKAGNENSFGVIPSVIRTADSGRETEHLLVLSLRAFDPLEKVKEELKNIPYRELKDFSVSAGFDNGPSFFQTGIAEALRQCGSVFKRRLLTEYSFNTGTSDGSIIYNSLNSDVRSKIVPVVMGPGSRSRRKENPPRLTHGKNETFDKEAGNIAINFITEILKKLGCLEGGLQ